MSYQQQQQGEYQQFPGYAAGPPGAPIGVPQRIAVDGQGGGPMQSVVVSPAEARQLEFLRSLGPVRGDQPKVAPKFSRFTREDHQFYLTVCGLLSILLIIGLNMTPQRTANGDWNANFQLQGAALGINLLGMLLIVVFSMMNFCAQQNADGHPGCCEWHVLFHLALAVSIFLTWIGIFRNAGFF